MISANEANVIAQNEINKIAPKDMEVIITKTIEFDEGWLFFYNSKEAFETGNVPHGLLGNVPLIVDKADGAIYYVGMKYLKFDKLESPEFYSKLLKQFRENQN